MKNKILFLNAGLVACTFFLISCSNQADQTAKANLEMNKATMNKIYEAFSTGNTADLSNYVESNFVEQEQNPNIKETGIEGLKKTIEMYRGSFPNLKMNPVSIIAEGDLVTVRFNMTGANTGPMGEMPPTNKSIDIEGVDIIKFKDGKAVEHWGFYQEMKMMEQLGMMQESPGMPLDSTQRVE